MSNKRRGAAQAATGTKDKRRGAAPAATGTKVKPPKASSKAALEAMVALAALELEALRHEALQLRQQLSLARAGLGDLQVLVRIAAEVLGAIGTSETARNLRRQAFDIQYRAGGASPNAGYHGEGEAGLAPAGPADAMTRPR